MPHLKIMKECLETTGEQNGLRRLIDTLPGLVWTALSDGSSDILNRGWRQYTCVPIEQGCGHGWDAASHPDDLQGLLEKW